VEAEVASRRPALRGAGGAHLGQLETAASAAKANASIVELETLALDGGCRSNLRARAALS
jgi:hypothetical protein